MAKILISSCLLGLNVRFDGRNKRNDKLVEFAKNGDVIFVCPEQLGGLPTPREPSEIESGKTALDVINGDAKVLTISGADVTKEYLDGAQKTLNLCKDMGVKVAILKSKSPSCGSTLIYDGTFTGNKIAGMGVVAKLLEQNGIKVYDEENYPESLFINKD